MATDDTQLDVEFVNPRDLIVVAGDRWVDDSIEWIDYESDDNAGDNTLDPGESLTAAEMYTTRDGEYLAVKAAATTSHGGDIDGDGKIESVVKYNVEVKKENIEDKYSPLPGLSSTLSMGRMGDPKEFIPGTYVGPVKAFRIRIENRSDGWANPLSLDVDEIGTHLHGRVLRNGSNLLNDLQG